MSDAAVGWFIVAGAFVAFGLAGALWSRRQRMSMTDTEPEEINVGITSATLVMRDGGMLTLTVPGKRVTIGGTKMAFTSEGMFEDAISEQWIPTDTGRIVNRDAVDWVTDKTTKEFYL